MSVTEGTGSQKITPFLWFNGNVEEAVNFYTSVFKDSKVIFMHHLPGETPGVKGKALTGTIMLNGMEFMLLDGGPMYTFNPSVSFFVHCKTQEEVDYYWGALLANGGRESRCGWLQDQFGLSWQIIPDALGQLMGDPDRKKAGAVMNAMMGMVKIDVAALQKAYDEA
jgi:predicted 3-demethylubiquinone-9 3-methyltransferase (glyoxalase superfamily)